MTRLRDGDGPPWLRWRRVLAGLAVVALLAGLSQVPAGFWGPEPAIVPHDYRRWVKLGVLAIAALGLLAARRAPATGGAAAVFAGVLFGVVAAFEYHPAIATAAAVAVLAPALWLVATARKGPARAIALGLAGALLAGGAYGAYAGYDAAYGPTHPQSRTPGPPDGIVEWIWVGGVGPDRAVITAKLADPGAEVDLRLSPPGGVVSSTRDGAIVRLSVSGLRAGRRYRYAIEPVAAVPDGSGKGAFRTFPAAPASFTVAFSSCARTGSNGVVFDAIRAEAPLLYLNVGDMYYANIEANDPGRFRKALDRALTRPAQANLLRSTAAGYLWDDHDYGEGNADGTSRSRPAAHRVYRQYVPHYPLALPGDEAPIAQALTVGRVRFILTDTRSSRSPKGARDDERKTMLGAEQRAWLERELLAANGRYPVIAWVNPDPWIGPARGGADGWYGYATERRAIADFVAVNRIRGVVMLSGDSHSVALDDGTNSGFASARGRGFPVLHAGALDRFPQSKGGPYSHGEFPGGGQFGTMEVRDTGGPSVTVTLRGLDWRGRELTSLRLDLPARASGG